MPQLPLSPDPKDSTTPSRGQKPPLTPREKALKVMAQIHRLDLDSDTGRYMLNRLTAFPDLVVIEAVDTVNKITKRMNNVWGEVFKECERVRDRRRQAESSEDTDHMWKRERLVDREKFRSSPESRQNWPQWLRRIGGQMCPGRFPDLVTGDSGPPVDPKQAIAQIGKHF